MATLKPEKVILFLTDMYQQSEILKDFHKNQNSFNQIACNCNPKLKTVLQSYFIS